jgi:predicted phage terminase large subunit-like protein
MVFSGVSTYSEEEYRQLTSDKLLICCGIDLAATDGAGDASVAIILGTKDRHVYYVLDMIYAHERAAVFANRLLELQSRHKGLVFGWFYGGMEKAVGSLLRSKGLNLAMEAARASKLVRAEGVAAAWNEGRVLVPDFRDWSSTLVQELLDFKGEEKRGGEVGDDCVDALATAWWLLQSGRWGGVSVGVAARVKLIV